MIGYYRWIQRISTNYHKTTILRFVPNAISGAREIHICLVNVVRRNLILGNFYCDIQ